MNEKSNTVKFKLYPAKLSKEESLQYIINQRYLIIPSIYLIVSSIIL